MHSVHYRHVSSDRTFSSHTLSTLQLLSESYRTQSMHHTVFLESLLVDNYSSPFSCSIPLSYPSTDINIYRKNRKRNIDAPAARSCKNLMTVFFIPCPF